MKFVCRQYDCQDKVVDLDKLVGIRVKTMWESEGEWQHVSQIRGLDPTLNIIASGQEIAPGLTDPPESIPQGEEEESNVPF